MLDEEEKPIGELFGQLIDDGKAFAQAEIGLVKAQAADKAAGFKRPALLIAGALLLVIAAVVTLVETLADALATLIGPLAGGLVAVLIAIGVATGLGLAAKNGLKAGQ